MQLLMQITHFKALSLTSMVVEKIHDEGCNVLKNLLIAPIKHHTHH